MYTVSYKDFTHSCCGKKNWPMCIDWEQKIFYSINLRVKRWNSYVGVKKYNSIYKWLQNTVHLSEYLWTVYHISFWNKKKGSNLPQVIKRSARIFAVFNPFYDGCFGKKVHAFCCSFVSLIWKAILRIKNWMVHHFCLILGNILWNIYYDDQTFIKSKNHKNYYFFKTT